MSEPAEKRDAPTPLALAAKAFVEGIGHPVTLRTLRTRAQNGGWVGSRAAGCWNAKASDAISIAAFDAVIELLRQWASEVDEDAPDDTDQGAS